MATTKIWAVHTRLDKVIDYATDEEKTILKTIKADEGLELVYKYATNSKKTEEQFFVTGVNCIPEIALDEMRITKRFYAKNEKIVGFHAYQSFAKGEVQPELAHKIGVRLAEEMWGDRFQVVVTTHLNTNCIHNHFVLNSISFKDGKSYYDNRENYALLRETSDLLCDEYGLSVIQEKACPKSKINYSNYLKNKYQNSNYYITTKEDIDMTGRKQGSHTGTIWKTATWERACSGSICRTWPKAAPVRSSGCRRPCSRRRGRQTAAPGSRSCPATQRGC